MKRRSDSESSVCVIVDPMERLSFTSSWS